MYFTNDGFVISGLEIILIISALSIIIIIFISLGRINRYVKFKLAYKSDDYPGTSFEYVHKENKLDTYNFSDISDPYDENELNRERQKKVIFEEIISDVSFRYDEKTKILTIEEMRESSTEPIEVKLNSLDDLREFVDRLEDYVNEYSKKN